MFQVLNRRVPQQMTTEILGENGKYSVGSLYSTIFKSERILKSVFLDQSTNMIASSVSHPKVASLFSGCGGFDLGFQLAGYGSLCAFDICPNVVNVFRNNIHNACEQLDLSSASIARRSFGRPDVVIAGSPCQGFSTLGHRRIKDPRNSLYLRGTKIAIELSPRVIVLENVTGILSKKMSGHLLSAISCLENAKYYTKLVQLRCSDFGVPQIRKRVFLIACKAKKPLVDFEIATRPKQSLKQALAGVRGLQNHEPNILDAKSDAFKIAVCIGQHQKLCNVRGGERAVATWDIPSVFGRTTKHERAVLCSIRSLRRRIRVRETGDADPVRLSDLKFDLGSNISGVLNRLIEKRFVRKIGRRFDLTNTFNGKYRRLSYTHPSPAVDTRFGMPNYFLHPTEHRGFTVREAARIQGFPDDFVFDGSISKQFQMIGNAVPVPVAECIAIAIKQYLL